MVDCIHWGENRVDERFIDVGCVLGHGLCKGVECSDFKSCKTPKFGVEKAGVNTQKSSDVFSRQQASRDAVKKVGEGNLDLFRAKVKRPCDDIASWSSCDGCADPCEEPTLLKFQRGEE